MKETVFFLDFSKTFEFFFVAFENQLEGFGEDIHCIFNDDNAETLTLRIRIVNNSGKEDDGDTGTWTFLIISNLKF